MHDDSIGQVFPTGSNITISGIITFDPSVDTPLTLDAFWTKVDPVPTDLTAGEHVAVTIPYQVQESPMIYETTLTIATVNGDSGNYSLEIDVTSHHQYTNGTRMATVWSIIVEGNQL